MKPRILFLSQLGEADHPARAGLPDEREMIETVFVHELGCELRFVDLTREPIPDDPFEGAPTDGVVISGSFGSANDAEPWRLALKEWLRAPVRLLPGEAVDPESVPRGTLSETCGETPLHGARHAPRLGFCGGHQLLAVAWGGEVGPAPAPQMGLYPLHLDGEVVPVVQLHNEAVRVPPPHATRWAEDACGIQALRYPGHTWTTQFHPELTADLTAGAVARHGKELDPAALAEAIAVGRALIRRWLEGLPRS